jgi:WD40 repeat protein
VADSSHGLTVLAAFVSCDGIEVRELSSGKCLLTLADRDTNLRAVTFSHDSALIASVLEDDTIKIWETSSGKRLQTLTCHGSAVSDRTIRKRRLSDDIWFMQTQSSRRSNIVSITFSHDSTLVAVILKDKTIKTWETSSGRCLRTLRGHDKAVNSASFSHDSALIASASEDGTVKMTAVYA